MQFVNKRDVQRDAGVSFIRVGIVMPVLALLAVLSPAGCGEPGTSGDELAIDDGALRGELAVYIADSADGHSETHYALRAPSGAERPLLFDPTVREADLQPGATLKVWGNDSLDGVRVARFQTVTPPFQQQQSALQTGTPYAARAFAFVLVDLGGGFNPAITSDDVLGRMINNSDSIRNYYINDSYGLQDITTQVFGPIKYTLNGCTTTSNTMGPGQLANDLRAMIPGTFQHYLWYFGTNQSACQWSGLASLGTPDKPSKDTWYNASTNCVVLVQEPGHNFGMQHSSSLACPGASFADDPNSCTASEYGDLFDPMGNGCRHMNAWQKTYQGWLAGCNGVAITSSGTFTVLPFENRCDGAQFLKIKAPKVRSFMRPAAGGGSATTETLAYYYVELRTPVDFDGTLGNRSALTPSLLIHVADDVHTRSQKGLHTFLLDMTPTTTGSRAFNDAALPVGATFTDPAGGVSITATAVSATQATVTVDIEGGTGAPTCLDGTTFTAPGPGPESCGAATGPTGGASGTGSGGNTGTTGSGGTTATGGRTGTTGSGGTTVMPGSGGAVGTNGSGGSAGSSGGAPGTGGRATTASGGRMGTAGRGGNTAPSGSGGMSSSGGSGGSAQGSGGGAVIAGSGGARAASGGNTGSGGTSSPKGSGGNEPSGSGGSAPMGAGATDSVVQSGCQCASTGSGELPWASGLTFGVVAVLGSRRRRSRR